MKVAEINDPAEKVYLIPLGDIHIGSKYVDIKKLFGYVDWIASRPSTYVFLMGDLFDVATRDSKTSPFEQGCDLNTAMDMLREILSPIKSKIIGCIQGNHEHRLYKYSGYDILKEWCDNFGIKYFGYSAALRFKIGNKRTIKNAKPVSLDSHRIGIINTLGLHIPKDNKKHKEKLDYIEYIFYAHHTVGGGRTIGGKLNKSFQLTSVFAGADCYLGGHNHSKAFGEDAIAYLDKRSGTVKYKRILYVDCGSFQKFDGSYAEKGALPPSHTGVPRIRMSGIEKDLHISF